MKIDTSFAPNALVRVVGGDFQPWHRLRPILPSDRNIQLETLGSVFDTEQDRLWWWVQGVVSKIPF